MNDAVSPFTAPAQPLTGAPVYCYMSQPPPQAERKQRKPKQAKNPSTPVKLPFAYGARCAIYSIVLVGSLLGLIFAVLAVSGDTYMSIRVAFDVLVQSSYYGNYTSRRVERVTVPAPNRGAWDYSCSDGTMTNVTAAVGLLISSDWGVSYLCVPSPAAVYGSSGCAGATVALSLFLLVLSCLVLGILGCQRRSVFKDAVVAEGEAALRQVQEHARETAATGAQVFIVTNDPTAPAVAPVSVPAVDRTVQRAAQAALDAKARRVLGIVCLVLSAVALVLSAIGFATTMAPESTITAQLEEARAAYPATDISISQGAIDSLLGWTQATNLVLFAITTVLLSVPYLSGIADRPARQSKQEQEAVATAVMGDEELQASGPSYTK